MRILVGVGGGIAAYKAVSVVRGLQRAGHAVRVIPTHSCLKMVAAPTWEALTGHRVHADVFASPAEVEHVTLAHNVDLFAVVPATANLLARLRAGMADDMLTATALNTRAPLHIFPAMHTNMWLHPATVDNVRALRQRGAVVHEPAVGALSSGDSGAGRLTDPAQIVELLLAQQVSDTLAGRHVVISAGGTREPLDPVRYLGNRSSGRMGCALASAALARGAKVSLVAANVDPALLPPGVEVSRVHTALDLRCAMRKIAPQADLVVMAAAVADYMPCQASSVKIKKEGARQEQITLRLKATPDVLAELVESRLPGQIIVGFAAETGDHREVIDLARAKLAKKGCDYLVCNRVGRGIGFGDVDTEVQVLARPGLDRPQAHFSGSKQHVAGRVLDHIMG